MRTLSREIIGKPVPVDLLDWPGSASCRCRQHVVDVLGNGSGNWRRHLRVDAGGDLLVSQEIVEDAGGHDERLRRVHIAGERAEEEPESVRQDSKCVLGDTASTATQTSR